MGTGLAGKVWVSPQECTTNLWVLLLGKSEVDHKSTSARYACNVLSDVLPDKIMSDPGSYEGFISALSGPAMPDGTSKGQRLLKYLEFQFLLDKFRPGSYSAPLMSLLNDLYDFTREYRRELVNRKFVVNRAAISILGGCTPQHIEKRQNEEFWQGGFFSRITIVSGTKTKRLPRARPNRSEHQMLCELFAKLANANPRELDFTPDADQTFDKWSYHNLEEQEKSHPMIKAAVGRLNPTVCKVAAIREIDTNLNEATHISEESLLWAIDFAEKVRDSLNLLPRQIAFSPEMQKKRSLMEVVEAAGGSIPYSKLLRNSHLTAKELRIYLETLEQEGQIRLAGSIVEKTNE